MNTLIAEFFGTLLLVLLGNSVVANVVLDDTKGHGGGWIVITAGWGLGVFVAVALVGPHSGGHINPAVTFALALSGDFAWAQVPGYVAAQLAGAFAGAGLVLAVYQRHFAATTDAAAKQACFCTAPAIRDLPRNAFAEIVGTFVLIAAVLLAEPSPSGLAALGKLPVALVVFSIGLSLGGTTGYAINPARDLGPRLAHALLPVPGKADSGWSYGWVPVLAPLLGAALAVLVVKLAVA